MNQIKVRLNSFSLSTFNETYPHPYTMPPSICYPSSSDPFGDCPSCIRGGLVGLHPRPSQSARLLPVTTVLGADVGTRSKLD